MGRAAGAGGSAGVAGERGAGVPGARSARAAKGPEGGGSVDVVPPTRRYPNFVAFISTGVILGFVIGSAFAYYGGSNTTEYGRTYSASSSILFLGVLGACVFGLIAAVVAVLLERRN